MVEKGAGKRRRQMQGPHWQVASPGVSAIFHVRNNRFTDLHSFFSRSNVHHGTATHSSHQPNENTPPSQLAPITITTKPISTYSTPHHPSHMLHGNLHPSSHSYHSLQHSAPALMHHPHPLNQMQPASYNPMSLSTSYQFSAHTSWNHPSYGDSTFTYTPPSAPTHNFPSSDDSNPYPYQFSHGNPYNPY